METLTRKRPCASRSPTRCMRAVPDLQGPRRGEDCAQRLPRHPARDTARGAPVQSEGNSASSPRPRSSRCCSTRSQYLGGPVGLHRQENLAPALEPFRRPEQYDIVLLWSCCSALDTGRPLRPTTSSASAPARRRAADDAADPRRARALARGDDRCPRLGERPGHAARHPDTQRLIGSPRRRAGGPRCRLIAGLYALPRPRPDRAVLGPRPPLRLRGRAASRRPGDRRRPGRLEAGAARASGAHEQRPVAFGDPEAAPARALDRAAWRPPDRRRHAAAGRHRRCAEAAVRGPASARRGRVQVVAARALARAGRRAARAQPAGRPHRRTVGWRQGAGGIGAGAGNCVVDGAGRLDLNQVATLLRGAALYVGGDTSITHLAAACEIPVVALYGPINPRYFGPWPANATLEVPYVAHALVQRAGPVSVLQGTPACVPCDRAGCEDRNDSPSVCLQTMAPARVVAEAQRSVVPLDDNEAMSAGEPIGGDGKGRPVKAVILAGPRATARRLRRGDRASKPKLIDRDRRPTDSRVHPEDLLGRRRCTTS